MRIIMAVEIPELSGSNKSSFQQAMVANIKLIRLDVIITNTSGEIYMWILSDIFKRLAWDRVRFLRF